jgi:hypothetical protein
MSYEEPPSPCEIEWKIDREGRAWEDEEVRARYDLAPHKIELIHAKLLWTDEERLTVLGLLLENCGAEAAVRMGDPEVWRRAVRLLDDAEATFNHDLEASRRMQERAVRVAENAPGYLPRFLDRWAVADYQEFDGEAWHTRADVSALREAVAGRVSEAVSHPARFEIRGESVSLMGDLATVLTRWTTVRPLRETATDGRSVSAGKEITVSRWREEWRRTSAGWRVVRSERLEGPTVFREESEGNTNANPS